MSVQINNKYNDEGKTTYIGTILGFSYCETFNSDEEFKAWLKGKINSPLIKELLGIDQLEARIVALEKAK